MGLIVALGACVAMESTLRPVPEAEPDEAERLPPAALGRTPSAGDWRADHDDDGDALFREGALHELAITLGEAEIASLRSDPRAEVPAQLGWRGKIYEVAIRLKGSYSFRTIDQKPSFKIDVHAFDPDQELDGLERLTLNNLIQDGSMIREHVYYAFAGLVGIPASRHAYARVTVNGAPYGLYGIVETVDEQFLGRAFPDDPAGNLYEAGPADFIRPRPGYLLEEDGGQVPVWEDLDAVIAAVDDARDTRFDEVLTERFDRGTVLDYLALDMLVGNSDGYVYNYHNYFAYHAPLSDRWTLLPWGTDLSFHERTPPLGDAVRPAKGYLFVSCWNDATCGPELRARTAALLDIWEAELPAIAEAAAALVEVPCQEDPRNEEMCHPSEVVDFVRERPADIRPWL